MWLLLLVYKSGYFYGGNTVPRMVNILEMNRSGSVHQIMFCWNFHYTVAIDQISISATSLKEFYLL